MAELWEDYAALVAAEEDYALDQRDLDAYQARVQAALTAADLPRMITLLEGYGACEAFGGVSVHPADTLADSQVLKGRGYPPAFLAWHQAMGDRTLVLDLDISQRIKDTASLLKELAYFDAPVACGLLPIAVDGSGSPTLWDTRNPSTPLRFLPHSEGLNCLHGEPVEGRREALDAVMESRAATDFLSWLKAGFERVHGLYFEELEACEE